MMSHRAGLGCYSQSKRVGVAAGSHFRIAQMNLTVTRPSKCISQIYCLLMCMKDSLDSRRSFDSKRMMRGRYLTVYVVMEISVVYHRCTIRLWVYN